MTPAEASRPWRPAREEALETLATSAASNIPGVDFVSSSVRNADGSLHTVVPTDPLAERADSLQYELREGPCYAAVTDERFRVLAKQVIDGTFESTPKEDRESNTWP
jgi:hypothetical protein